MMSQPVIGEFSWERMLRAAERFVSGCCVRPALLEAANIPYAVAGGNAVAAWVTARLRGGGAQHPGDVDILIRCADLERVKEALEKAGFVYRHAASIDMFLDRPGAEVRDAVHVVFANEKVRAEYLIPAPDVTDMESFASFRALSLDVRW